MECFSLLTVFSISSSLLQYFFCFLSFMENQQGFVMPQESAEGIVIEPSTVNNLEGILAPDPNLGTHGDDSAGTFSMQDLEEMNSDFLGIFGVHPNDLPNNYFEGAPHQPIHNSGIVLYQPMNNFGTAPNQPINNSGIAPCQPMNNNQPINNLGSASHQPMNNFGSASNQPINILGSASHQHVNNFGSDQPNNYFGSAVHQPNNNFQIAPHQPNKYFGSTFHQPNNFGSALQQPNSSLGIAPHEPNNNFGVVPYQPINNRPAVIVPEAQLQPRHLAEGRPRLMNEQQLQLHPRFRRPPRRQRTLHRDMRPYPLYAPRGTGFPQFPGTLGIPPLLYDHSFQEAGLPVDPHVREFIATGLSESYEIRRRIDASPNDRELRRVVEILNCSLDSN